MPVRVPKSRGSFCCVAQDTLKLVPFSQDLSAACHCLALQNPSAAHHCQVGYVFAAAKTIIGKLARDSADNIKFTFAKSVSSRSLLPGSSCTCGSTNNTDKSLSGPYSFISNVLMVLNYYIGASSLKF